MQADVIYLFLVDFYFITQLTHSLLLHIVILREDITVDQFIDVIEGNRAYIPVLYVFNKIDALTIEELDILDQMPNYVPISSQHGWNIEELMESVWDRCNMLRIYTKPKGTYESLALSLPCGNLLL